MIRYVVDTSYLTELFSVPGFSDEAAGKEVWMRFHAAIEKGYNRYVPLPCLFELSNHIADERNGNKRRELAQKLYKNIGESLGANGLWITTPAVSLEDFLPLYKTFADEFAQQGVGLIDSFIIQEARILKKKYPEFKVHIWTKDKALKTHEPDSEENAFV